MGFLVLAQIMDLNMAVEVGLVTGVTPATMPTGSAISRYPSSTLSSITPTVFSCLTECQIYSVEKMFLVTLSSKMPLPVSSTAILASSICAESPARAIASVILSICC